MKNRDEKYQEFFKLFDNEEYFQSHEILEEIWIEETGRKTKNHPAIVLLQFAVALLHWKRGNIKGANLVLNSALNHLQRIGDELIPLGIEGKKLGDAIKLTMVKIERGEKYSQIKIPKIL